MAKSELEKSPKFLSYGHKEVKSGQKSPIIFFKNRKKIFLKILPTWNWNQLIDNRFIFNLRPRTGRKKILKYFFYIFFGQIFSIFSKYFQFLIFTGSTVEISRFLMAYSRKSVKRPTKLFFRIEKILKIESATASQRCQFNHHPQSDDKGFSNNIFFGCHIPKNAPILLKFHRIIDINKI